MFKDYSEVRDWLESYIPLVYGKEELGLARITELLDRLGNPQNKFKSIHIGGTAGKGSTAFYTARLLQRVKESKGARGVKVGLHVSPHLSYIGERMQINGKVIGEIRLIRLIGEIRPVVEAIQKERPELTPSYFEILVAATFVYFAQEKMDWAVVEVGLGGRLDATNVLMPEVAVITNVGLDHTEILGDTVEKIAREKAGIIKESKRQRARGVKAIAGVPVVTAARGKALAVIKKVAAEKGARLVQITNTKYPIPNAKYCTKETAGLAIKTVETALRQKGSNPSMTQGYTLSAAAISEAFAVGFPGRFEEIEKGVILDGAHNPDKIRALLDFVRKFEIRSTKSEISNSLRSSSRFAGLRALNHKPQIQNSKQVTLVVAFKKGKDWKTMVDLLLKNLPVEQIIATEFQAVTDTGKFAAVTSVEIAGYVESKSIVRVKSIRNSQEAVFEAVENSKFKIPGSIVLVTGSLYLVGEVRPMWEVPLG